MTTQAIAEMVKAVVAELGTPMVRAHMRCRTANCHICRINNFVASAEAVLPHLANLGSSTVPPASADAKPADAILYQCEKCGALEKPSPYKPGELLLCRRCFRGMVDSLAGATDAPGKSETGEVPANGVACSPAVKCQRCGTQLVCECDQGALLPSSAASELSTLRAENERLRNEVQTVYAAARKAARACLNAERIRAMTPEVKS